MRGFFSKAIVVLGSIIILNSYYSNVIYAVDVSIKKETNLNKLLSEYDMTKKEYNEAKKNVSADTISELDFNEDVKKH